MQVSSGMHWGLEFEGALAGDSHGGGSRLMISVVCIMYALMVVGVALVYAGDVGDLRW
jgi:hypothetical protein